MIIYILSLAFMRATIDPLESFFLSIFFYLSYSMLFYFNNGSSSVLCYFNSKLQHTSESRIACTKMESLSHWDKNWTSWFTCVSLISHTWVDGALEVSQGGPYWRTSRDAMPVGTCLPCKATGWRTLRKQVQGEAGSSQTNTCTQGGVLVSYNQFERARLQSASSDFHCYL